MSCCVNITVVHLEVGDTDGKCRQVEYHVQLTQEATITINVNPTLTLPNLHVQTDKE